MAYRGKKYFVRNCCAIILAAGGSSRLGEPKQLLQFHGKTLLQHTIDEALRASLQSVILVLGLNRERILRETNCRNLQVAINTEWHTGMASSILAGMSALAGLTPPPDGVLLLVCDQPFVDSCLLDAIMEKQKSTGKPIVACDYQGTLGVPALFHESCFRSVRALHGDSGARHLIRTHSELVAPVPFPRGSIDIDTMADYQWLNEKS